MKEILDTIRMSHFLLFDDDLYCRNLTFKRLDISFFGNYRTRIMQTRWNDENEAGN